jgi:transmembrane sensor
MNAPDHELPSPRDDAVAAAAAGWVMRQDRGLSSSEQDAFLQWLAASPRHAEAMARQRDAWDAFDRLAGLRSSMQVVPDPDLLAPSANLPPRFGRVRFGWAALSLAAVATVALVLWQRGAPSPPEPRAVPPVARAVPSIATIEERTLDDGSVVRLNRGAAVVVEFSATERRVRLERGEAAFAVAKDAARPFVVEATGVAVRAVGTAFNVRLADRAVEVIITEGRVAVAGGASVGVVAVSELVAGHRAWVPVDATAGAPAVGLLPADELARRLAWHPRLLSFTEESLASILNEFNRHNPVVLRADSAALGELRLTARFRSDNVDGFLRLLASDFGVQPVAGEHGDIVLRSVK